MGRKLRILTIDTECLPGHWIGGDYVSKILTAVAWKWGDRSRIGVETHYKYDPSDLAYILADEIADADIVVGHYIRGFDLPLINGTLFNAGLPSFEAVTTHDTKLDLLKTHGRSLSQKNLSAMVGVSAPKIDVTLSDWEGFNMKMPGYEDKGVERVKGDVFQNIEMRGKLLELGWLGPTRVWSPTPSGSKRYHG